MKIAVAFSEKMARLEILLVFSQVAEARIGRLSSSQREFTTIRSKKNSLIELDKRRNGEEDPLLRRLQTKLFHSKRNMSDYNDRLLIKPMSSAKSVAERVTKSRASQGKKSDPTGAEREARRKRGRSRDQVEKEREDERVRKVSERAGGLSSKEGGREGRPQVEQGQCSVLGGRAQDQGDHRGQLHRGASH